MTKKIKVKKLQNSPYMISPDELIGKGTFGIIVKAYNTDHPNQGLACKIISVTDQQTNSTIKAQLKILKQLPYHPNLVNYKKLQITSSKNVYLIMQLCQEGNLDKYMFDRKYVFTEEKIWFFLRQFCEGYKLLYERAIVHRDIKPQNILIGGGNFKIADFGLSKPLNHPQLTQNLSAKGTPLYMAPQLHQQKQGCSKIDIFSLGIVLYRMAFQGNYPYFDQDRKYRSISEYFKELIMRKLVIPENPKRSKELVELIQRMLCKDKEGRIGWLEIFDHPKVLAAARTERKKELMPLNQFKKSFVMTNKSITKVQPFESDQPEAEDEICITVEQIFNKNQKSSFQRKLYHHKLTYTLIQYVNKKINYFIQRKKMHKYVQGVLNKLVEKGFQYCLFVIGELENVSGQWGKVNQMQVAKFEEIFDNDRLIIEDEWKNNTNNIKTNSNPPTYTKQTFKRHTYQDLLYTLLTQYSDYPTDLRFDLRPIIGLLVDIYDLVMKFGEKQIEDEKNQQNIVDIVEDKFVSIFYDYLMDVEKIGEKELIEKMQRKGLVVK